MHSQQDSLGGAIAQNQQSPRGDRRQYAGPAFRPPGKRLALFFDGTWNTPGNNTNVWRLALMLAEQGSDGVSQRKFYDEGVGTHWFDSISGGAFGYGVSDNIRSGYRWLMEHYNEGDEIFIFGFSRGAFTARSLTGVIARCGLLKPDAPMSFTQLYDRYRQGSAVRPIYQLIYDRKHGKTDFSLEEKVLMEYTYYRRNLIKMVGVWDTVGALGIPFGNFPGISRRTLGFHNTHLSKVVQNCYQALALDEQRSPYKAFLWTHYVPITGAASPRQEDTQVVEQRWFSGAHCNVGGGYRNDLMPQRPLAWIQTKAQDWQLAFRADTILNDDDLAMQPRDSYSEFLGGVWKAVTFGKRYERWVFSNPVRKLHVRGENEHGEGGWVETVNERVDASVFERCRQYADYRPVNLLNGLRRRNIDFERIKADPACFPEITGPVQGPGVESHIPLTHGAGQTVESHGIGTV